MRHDRRQFITTVATGAALLGTHPGAARAQGRPRPGGVLQVGTSRDDEGKGYDHHGQDFAHYEAGGQVMFNFLIRYDDRFGFVPDLAERWTVQDGGKAYQFFLRKDVKFWDGTDCDAEAIKWNFERILNPEHKLFRRQYFTDIDQIEPGKDNSIRFVLKAPSGEFMHNLLLRGGLGFNSPSAVRKWGKEYPHHIVSTGPFRWKEYKAGSHLILERNDRYFRKGLPHLDQIVIKRISDPNARDVALRTGEIHLNLAQELQTAGVIARQKGLRVVNAPQLNTVYVDLNLRKPQFKDLRVRQALGLYGVNREEIAQTALLGQVAPVLSLVPPGSPYFSDYPELRAYDPDRARRMLREAGVERLAVKISLSNVYQVTTDVAVLLKTQWERLGVTTTVEVLEHSTWLGKLFAKNVEEMFDVYVAVSAPKVHPQSWYPFLLGPSNLNWNRYENAEVDRLFQQAKGIVDNAQATQAFREIFRRVAAEGFYVSLTGYPRIRSMTARLEGVADPGNSWLNLEGAWLAT